MSTPFIAGIDRVGIALKTSPEQRDNILFMAKDYKQNQCLYGQRIGTQFKIENTRFRQFREDLRVETTLPRYLRGSNLLPVTFHEFPVVIQLISEWLQVDFLQGRIHYIEINVTKGTSVQPREIFKTLGHLSRFHGETKDDGRRVYSNSQKPILVSQSLCFYDWYQKMVAFTKDGSEERSASEIDLHFFQGFTPARIEYTLERDALHGDRKLYVRDLLVPETWTQICCKFAMLLESIHINKSASKTLPSLPLSKPTDLLRWLASDALRTRGVVEVENLVRSWRKDGHMDRFQEREFLKAISALLTIDVDSVWAHDIDNEVAQFINSCIGDLRGWRL